MERVRGLSGMLRQSRADQAAQASRFNALKDREAWREKVVVSDNLFPTPPEIAQRLVELAGLSYGMHVLEPSCGTGRIVEAIAPHVDTLNLTVDACEISPPLLADCQRRFPFLAGAPGDFLQFSTPHGYDRIIMNPPFRMGADIRHILQAKNLLAIGGKVVSLCYDGTRQNRDLRPLCDTWEVLPAGSFKSEGTGAGVVLLTISI